MRAQFVQLRAALIREPQPAASATAPGEPRHARSASLLPERYWAQPRESRNIKTDVAHRNQAAMTRSTRARHHHSASPPANKAVRQRNSVAGRLISSSMTVAHPAALTAHGLTRPALATPPATPPRPAPSTTRNQVRRPRRGRPLQPLSVSAACRRAYSRRGQRLVQIRIPGVELPRQIQIRHRRIGQLGRQRDDLTGVLVQAAAMSGRTCCAPCPSGTSASQLPSTSRVTRTRYAFAHRNHPFPNSGSRSRSIARRVPGGMSRLRASGRSYRCDPAPSWSADQLGETARLAGFGAS